MHTMHLIVSDCCNMNIRMKMNSWMLKKFKQQPKNRDKRKMLLDHWVKSRRNLPCMNESQVWKLDVFTLTWQLTLYMEQTLPLIYKLTCHTISNTKWTIFFISWPYRFYPANHASDLVLRHLMAQTKRNNFFFSWCSGQFWWFWYVYKVLWGSH